MRFTTILRYILSILVSYACTAVIFSSSVAEVPILRVVAIEAVRGAITLALGIPASLGIAATQVAQSLDCLSLFGILGRFCLLIWPNLLLGLLWQRNRLRGGLAALALSGLCQLAIQYPELWPLPSVGFITVAVFLLYPTFFQKPVNHATETQPL